MECNICLRRFDALGLPFLCPFDARSLLYPPRLAHVERLVENEALQAQIRHLLAQPNSRPAIEKARAHEQSLLVSTDSILAAASLLANDIDAVGREISDKKSALARRRADLVSISHGLQDRRASHLLQVQKDTQALMLGWSQSALDMARTRAFLCHEALKLYGLKRIRSSSSSGYEYQIAHIPVLDLTCMDSLSPAVISTSLGHLSHILLLLSHYLSIRLPAEITLPHRDYPRPTIFTLASSYQQRHASSASSQSSPIPSSSSTPDALHVPRPRPLFIDKPLQQLAKEDSNIYSLFIEAVSLLAYDLAWLSCSQGVPVGDTSSPDDIFHLGQTLYAISAAAQQAAVSAPQSNPSPPPLDGSVPPRDDTFGRPSHATIFNSLNSAEGATFVRSFKLASPIKLADRLKRRLAGDSAVADWELLDHDEWKIHDGPASPRVSSPHVSKTDPLASPLDASVSAINVPPKIASVNSWTKIKYRS